MEVSSNKTINNGNKNFSGFFFTLKRSVVIHSCLNRMTVPLSWVCIFKFLAQSQNLKRNFLLVIFSADLPCYVWCVLFFNYGWNNFYSTKIISQKIYIKAIKLFKLHLFALCEKLSNLSSFIFHLSFPNVLYKSILLSITVVY